MGGNVRVEVSGRYDGGRACGARGRRPCGRGGRGAAGGCAAGGDGRAWRGGWRRLRRRGVGRPSVGGGGGLWPRVAPSGRVGRLRRGEGRASRAGAPGLWPARVGGRPCGRGSGRPWRRERGAAGHWAVYGFFAGGVARSPVCGRGFAGSALVPAWYPTEPAAPGVAFMVRLGGYIRPNRTRKSRAQKAGAIGWNNSTESHPLSWPDGVGSVGAVQRHRRLDEPRGRRAGEPSQRRKPRARPHRRTARPHPNAQPTVNGCFLFGWVPYSTPVAQ